jgi:ribose-phosphate pyrophosphokinase
MPDFILFTGNANPLLAALVADQLDVRMGDCTVQRFPDGEVSVSLNESVRRKDVFLIQPTSPPVNDHLMELLVLADACRRSAASKITAVIPYFGYARADKRGGQRKPIAASMVADLMQAVGIDHVIAVDLHIPQIEGFFRVPVENLSAVPSLCEALRNKLPPDLVVVSPDSGRVAMATEYAQRLCAPVAVLHKTRVSGTETHVTRVVGDVKGRTCLIIDDMISTGGTIANSVAALVDAGAYPEVFVAATHGLFVENAVENLSHAAIRRIYTADTIKQAEHSGLPIHIVSIAPVIADGIRRVLMGQPLIETPLLTMS